ncbi:3-dehydroquinate synthase [Kangiella sediminilitoris]|uniref:3-dehydroquinate synthase n=1 Tax=Kangiella sediminilitoris TaxID=1144748 RepID=A0A1B3B8J1_9GAMM|nr:3-dehydroquinate synthase [Kangiella sediminilitoris]AOE49095.1 3-dehydroquinate synthase [Kangiella sediminilitoris]
MKTLDLRLISKESSYQIVIGKGLLSDSKTISEVIRGQQVFIVSNETVAPLYLDTLRSSLNQYQIFEYILPDGEVHKSFENYSRIINVMLDSGLRRNSTLIALGGGVVGDMAGFAAATYQRGIDFIQVPTTLLSQVDSSVGGKTAVNHPKGKNMIGAFHQPKRVVTDISTLHTLPENEFKAGLAEIVKVAVVCDEDFFNWLELNVDSILSGEEQALIYMINRACEIKANVVRQDEKEQGIRAWLNYGHTFGHAIENSLGYGQLLHGEAVSIGMVLAAEYASSEKLITKSKAGKIKQLLIKFSLPVNMKPFKRLLTADGLVDAMMMDKKNVDQCLTLILPKSIGEVTINHKVEPKSVRQFLRQYVA